MSQAKPFPFTWLPGWFRPHESTWSLAYRLSLANLITAEQVYNQLLSPLRSSPFDWLMAGKGGDQWLADLLGIPKSLADTAFLDDLVGVRVEEHLLAKHLRYCPACLKEQFHSALFQFLPLEACPIHKIPLQDGCPHCGKSTRRHALENAPETRCHSCGGLFLEPPTNWLEVVNAKVGTLPLTKCRKRLQTRKNKGYLEGAVPNYGSMHQGLCSVESLRAYLASEPMPRVEINEFMVPSLVPPRMSSEDLWSAMDSCRNALYSLHGQFPDGHANCFKEEYAAAFIERRLGLPLSNPAVGAYRLVEEFLGFLAPPNKRWELPSLSPRRFNKDFFAEYLETTDHNQRLPMSVGCAMAPLIVQALYLDALEYILAGKPDHPWTFWALEPDSFKYPVRWYGLATGKSTYKYQITVVTAASKNRLQEILATF